MDKKPKIAFVGIGRWGAKLLGEFEKQAEIARICHKGSEKSSKFLRENYPDIKTTTNIEDILKDHSIKAVVVATPINTHFEIAKRIINSGKHLFLEKPGGKNKDELQTLIALAKEKNVVFSVGYIFTYSPALSKIKGLARNEEIKAIYFDWFKWGSFDEHPILNLFSHDISILLSLIQKPVQVQKYSETGMISGADIINIDLENDQTKIHAYINRVSLEKRKTVTVITDTKSYIWNNETLTEIVHSDQNKKEIPVDNSLSNADIEIKDFLTCIKSSRAPKGDGNFASRVMALIEEIRELGTLNNF